eukprot:TRINITY_DN4204_c0_g1_i7.p1 TRINITY_DN4204_c0_g1~~TRINITY_DN4204_c0_g1_i7.p1  ORF type:complete len:605 (+),score=82.38 TRINITY_DN4204_c0_g1_i7:66-1880(+)
MAALRHAVWSAFAALSVIGHRPAHHGITCGSQFSTPKDALRIHDIEIEWAGSRVVTCESPMLWVTYEVPASMVGSKLYLSAGGVHTNSNPGASRFAHLRMDTVLLGPGMPTLNRSELPAHVSVPDTFPTGRVFRSPADQSTCAHSEWMRPMGALVEVGEPTVCTFLEAFTQTYMPVVLDVTPTVMQGGTYYAGFYLRTHETGKIWFAVGVVGGKEDFRTRFDIPKGECDCGDYNVLASDFHEKGEDHRNIPKVMSCDAQPPLAEYCLAPAVMDHKNDSHDHGGSSGSVGGDIKMGCGKMSDCSSSQGYMKEHMAMHVNMALEFECDVALDFVRGMIQHHEAALKMCKVFFESLSGAADAGIVHLCQHVQLEQKIEVTGMKNWLARTGGDEKQIVMRLGGGNVSCDASREFKAANERMHSGMAINYTCDSQLDFTRAMMPHHEGAVEMCEILTRYGKEDRYLWDLCSNITRMQRAELMFMSVWLGSQGHALAARCDDLFRKPEPCEDMLPISETCHSTGGDYVCSCQALTVNHSCGTTPTINGRRINITDFCQRTCGQCPERQPSLVGAATAAAGSVEASDVATRSLSCILPAGILAGMVLLLLC